jgi:hypothetical protein
VQRTLPPTGRQVARSKSDMVQRKPVSGSAPLTPQGRHPMPPLLFQSLPQTRRRRGLAKLMSKVPMKKLRCHVLVSKPNEIALRNCADRRVPKPSVKGGGAANNDDQAKAKVTALTALVLAKRKPRPAEQRQSVKEHDLSLTSDDLFDCIACSKSDSRCPCRCDNARGNVPSARHSGRRPSRALHLER